MRATHYVHALRVPREKVCKTPAWRQAVYWAGLACVDEVRKLGAISDKEDLQDHSCRNFNLQVVVPGLLRGIMELDKSRQLMGCPSHLLETGRPDAYPETESSAHESCFL